jgi:DHA2 family multidrug resistance protein-like MFS transporter
MRVSPASVVWVVNAFQLASTIFIVPLATYGDIVGFARIYRTGTALFIVASAFCALAHDLPSLVFWRTVQGIGASAILASSQPIARFAFPAAMLGVALGIQGVIVSTSSAAGPSVGGIILGVGSWPWLFWINIPFGLLALSLSGLLPALPRSNHRFDWPSAVMSGLTLTLFITGIDQLRAPADPALCAAETIGALVLGTLVVRRQRTLDPPFLAVDLMRIRVIRLSLVASILGFMAQNVVLIVLPFYFRALGYAPAATGFLMTAFPIGTAAVSLIAGRLSDRYHAGVLGAIGLAVFATALALLARLPDHPSTFAIVWPTALGGLGFGVFVSPNLRAMVGAAPRHRSGAITGLTTTARMTGSTMGVALTALVFSSSVAPATAGTGPLRIALWLAIGLAALTLAVSSLRLEAVPVSDP